MRKLWGHRFLHRVEIPLVEKFNASLGFDQRLWAEDIIGNQAYAKALYEAGVLTSREFRNIDKTLRMMGNAIKNNGLKLKDAEDIHTALEQILTKHLGKLGKKIHTGRSRNEQVVLDERLYLKKEMGLIIKDIVTLQQTLFQQAGKYTNCLMPGYTHLQPAQPVRFSHNLLAWFFMLARDQSRLSDALKRLDICPLGSGALAGTTYSLNRQRLAKQLGFTTISENALDATSDRDFLVEFVAGCAILMMHLSRSCEDLIIWSTQEFGFIELADELATSSSLMPQKKNPDTLELIRGKCGRVFGNLINLLTIQKGLPSGYNKDLQEDKPPLFDTVDTVRGCLKVFNLAIKTMQVNPARMRQALTDYLLSTDMVDYLVRQGVPFRESHGIVGQLVAQALRHHKKLSQLTLNEFRRFSRKFQSDVYKVLDITKSINQRNLVGGTSPSAIKNQLRIARQHLKRLTYI